MPDSQARLTFLAASISRAGGGVLAVLRKLTIAIKRENRYLLSVVHPGLGNRSRPTAKWIASKSA